MTCERSVRGQHLGGAGRGREGTNPPSLLNNATRLVRPPFGKGSLGRLGRGPPGVQPSRRNSTFEQEVEADGQGSLTKALLSLKTMAYPSWCGPAKCLCTNLR